MFAGLFVALLRVELGLFATVLLHATGELADVLDIGVAVAGEEFTDDIRIIFGQALYFTLDTLHFGAIIEIRVVDVFVCMANGIYIVLIEQASEVVEVALECIAL